MKIIESPVVRVKDGLTKEQYDALEVLNSKLYLLLFVGEDNETEAELKTWVYVRGAQLAYDVMYEYFVEMSEDETYDMLESRVIVDSPKISISNSISMYKFLKTQLDRNLIMFKTDFDIDDYCQEGEENEETE